MTEDTECDEECRPATPRPAAPHRTVTILGPLAGRVALGVDGPEDET